MGANMTFTEWIETVPRAIRDDPVWRVKLTGWHYSLAIWHGTTVPNCSATKGPSALADQLNRSGRCDQRRISRGLQPAVGQRPGPVL